MNSQIIAETKHWVAIPALFMAIICFSALIFSRLPQEFLIYAFALGFLNFTLLIASIAIVYNAKRHEALPLASYSHRIYKSGQAIAITSVMILLSGAAYYFYMANATGKFTFIGWYIPAIVAVSCIQDFSVYRMASRYKVR